jgi:uncharacterized protein (TIGR02466 family)
MQRFEYFPSCVYRDEHPEWVEQLSKVVEKYHAEAGCVGVLTQTAQMISDPDLKFLSDYLVLASDAVLREQGYDMDRYELHVSGLWGQDVKCFGGTNVHVHPHSQVCGWFFLETPEGGAYPVYHEPRQYKPMIALEHVRSNDLVNASSEVHFNNIRPGTVLMANAWLQHQLVQSTSQAQTKSIHFTVSHKDR